jgi:hypothetical protein
MRQIMGDTKRSVSCWTLIALITNWSKRWTDLIPKAGALIVMAFPKPRNGSGFPPGAIAIYS